MTDPSPRELEAWYAYLETGSMRAAGKRLGISHRTVRTHIDNVKQKMYVDTLPQLAEILPRPRAA